MNMNEERKYSKIVDNPEDIFKPHQGWLKLGNQGRGGAGLVLPSGRKNALRLVVSEFFSLVSYQMPSWKLET